MAKRNVNVEELLGGYATGTLTEEERRILIEAALHDQTLFDALADEQAFKDLLDDPQSRRRLLEAAAGQASGSRWGNTMAGWFQSPRKLAVAGSVIIAVVAVVFTVRLSDEAGRQAADQLRIEDTPPASTSEPDSSATDQGEPDEALTTESLRPADQLSKQQAPAPPSTESRTRDTDATSRTAAPAEKKESTPGTPPAAKPSVAQEAAPARPPEPPAPSIAKQEELGAVSRRPKAPLTARELFYAEGNQFRDVPGRRDTSAKPLGLRYSLLKQGPGDTWTEFHPQSTVQPGDAVRLAVEANQDGFLYVFQKRPEGRWRVLFPTAPAESGLAPLPHVAGRTRYTIPMSDSLSFAAGQTQTELILVFAKQAIVGLTQTELPGESDESVTDLPPHTFNNAVLSKMGAEAGKGNVVSGGRSAGEKGDDQDRAVYIFNPSTGAETPLITHVWLTH